ncbi:MAG: hypothetical protein H0W23_07685 [Chloroflexia bacterium]|nr:hypothetical protein [Chloroflexia bacterium]
MTGLRCNRCGKPICPRCAVRTPVGMRCPDCAGVRGLPTYRTPANDLLKAAGAGLLVASLVAVLWRFFPVWQFYLCLLLGFGTVEAMAKVANNKRGPDLRAAAILAITVGLVLSRILLAQRFGVSAADVNALESGLVNDEIFNEFGGVVSVGDVLQLRLVPDLLFALMAYGIAWVRFR